MARLIRARKAGSPLIVIPPHQAAVMLEAVKVWPSKAGKGGVRRKVGATPTLTSPARAGFAILRVGASKETDQKEDAPL